MSQLTGRRRRGVSKSWFLLLGTFCSGVVLGILMQRMCSETNPMYMMAPIMPGRTVQSLGEDEQTLLQRVNLLQDQVTIFKAKASAAVALQQQQAKNSSRAIAEVVNDSSLPTYDMLLVVFSGDSEDDAKRRDLMRRIYGRYRGRVVLNRGKKSRKKYKFKLVFVRGRSDAPEDGVLNGDTLLINAPDGYRNIVHKTKGMVSLLKHVNFKYLMKSDDDTFVCVQQVFHRLHNLPEETKKKVYAGVPTHCNMPGHQMVGRVFSDPTHKWYDERYVEHTMGSMECYPPYHQGAGYILSRSLVEFLYKGRDHLLTFINEDVTMGTWLMGVDRSVVSLRDLDGARLWECTCASYRFAHDAAFHKNHQNNAFFHNCKQAWQMLKCAIAMGTC
ncbi:galactosyltransferase-domain-containing protein [Tribonema minus]|uniref:Hexosyltransferase n=1 Tax=Tribonema minus TaxID=303371 RepID=A0A835YWI3_9STRA|nr:galactosyltransferase-domain-containing protein [Tribonema minus]